MSSSDPADIDAEAFRTFERHAHDRIAESYSDFLAPITNHAISPLLDVAGVREGSRVLDVACGPGLLAGEAAARHATVVAVDLSPVMLALARKQHPAVEFREGDAEALPFAEGSFDAVLCNFGLGHFPRPERAMEELARVLVPGGVVAVSWWQLPRSRLNGIFFDAAREAGLTAPSGVPAGPPPDRFSDERRFEQLLGSAALTDVRVSTLVWRARVESLDAWWNGGLGSMVRVAAVIAGQPADVLRRTREIFERLAREHAADGAFLVPLAASIATGRRPGPRTAPTARTSPA
jgi:SAM-dependent methyltransferase